LLGRQFIQLKQLQFVQQLIFIEQLIQLKQFQFIQQL
jgi:hypothetical protein